MVTLEGAGADRTAQARGKGLEALNKMRRKAEKDSWEIREHLWVIVTTESHIS